MSSRCYTNVKIEQLIPESYNFLLNEDFINFYPTINKVLNNTKKEIYPLPENLFNAFDKTPFDNIRVVIIGQDPYYNAKYNKGVMIPYAHGLSFSVLNNDFPPSLKNIFNNLFLFKNISKYPKIGNLENWAKQGCLMLNTTMTVQEGLPNSHADYWSEYSKKLIKYISDNKEKVVFVLWGGNAIGLKDLIDNKKHTIIMSSHPSPKSYDKPYGEYPAFNSIDHFGLINTSLDQKIDWNL